MSQLDALMLSLYPAEACHLTPVDAFHGPHTLFLGAFEVLPSPARHRDDMVHGAPVNTRVGDAAAPAHGGAGASGSGGGAGAGAGAGARGRESACAADARPVHSDAAVSDCGVDAAHRARGYGACIGCGGLVLMSGAKKASRGFAPAADVGGLAPDISSADADGGAEYAEVKRMFVAPAARKRGVGHAILTALVARAREAGVRLMRLESGVKTPNAVRLYERVGFRVTGVPYGTHALPGVCVDASVFMEMAM